MILERLARNQRFRRNLLDEVENILREPGEANDIMPGLIPIGDTGLYRTPDEPADPTDCARYPDSPYCGGNPFTLTPIGLDPEIINDGCNIGIRLNPAIAFIRLPPVALVYRKPECREPKTPPIEVVNDNSEKVQIHTGCGIYGPVAFKYYVKEGLSGGLFDQYEDQSWTGATGFAVRQIITYKKLGSGTYERYYDKVYEGPFVKTEEDIFSKFDIWLIEFIDCFGKLCRFGNILKGHISGVDVPYRFYYKGIEGLATDDVVFITKPNELPNLYPHLYNDEITPKKCPCQNYPPPPPKEICCMPQCCPPPDNTLLKLLIKKVNKLSEAIGVDELPAKMPKRVIYPNGKGEEELKNIVELLGYQVKQVDRAVGLLPQKIKVADTNPGLAGNQSVEVEIHSFADFAKEILQLLLDTEGDVDTTNNMLVRVLYELGFIHQGVVQIDAMADAIVEHLDFKQKWKKISVPFAFDPHAGTKGKVGQGFDKQKNTSGDGPQTEEEVERLLPALLQNTEVDIRILVNDEKKSLNDLLQDIKRDTAIAAAGVSERADAGKLDKLVAAAQLLLQLEGAIDRKNIRQALTSGNLRTAKKDS